MNPRLNPALDAAGRTTGAAPNRRSLVFYELYVRAFRDSNGDGHGDIHGVIEKLDYLEWLGVDVILLPALHSSPPHGDYAIDPEYGTVEQLRRLLDEAHTRGLKVITDLTLDRAADARAETERVVRYWLGLGFDGFRLPSLSAGDGANEVDLPGTHEFLRDLRAYVDGSAPDALLLGAVDLRPEESAAFFGEDGDELELLSHLPLTRAIFTALAEGRSEPLEHVLAATPEPPPGADWLVFLRDQGAPAQEPAGERDLRGASGSRTRPDLGVRRLAPALEGDRRRLELVHALLLTLPGAPLLYYGDEIGMGDDVSLGDRDGVRTPMQWSAEGGAGFSRNRETYAPVIGSGEFDHRKVNVAAARDDAGSLLNFVRGLLALRRERRALTEGSFSLLGPESDAVLAARHRLENVVYPELADDEALTGEYVTTAREMLSLYNFSASEQIVEWPLLALGGMGADMAGETGAAIAASSSDFTPTLRQGEALRLPPHSFVWLAT